MLVTSHMTVSCYASSVCSHECCGAQVPVGVAVEQPGGDYAYGAPASPLRAHGAYVPPSHPAAAAGHSPRAGRNDSAAQV